MIVAKHIANAQANLTPDKNADIPITNPVMVGAMNLTSAFDPKLDRSFDGAGITLDM
jgi:hypothetical protein